MDADDYIDKLTDKIEKLQASNAELSTKIEQMQEAIAYDMKNYLEMQAENERLKGQIAFDNCYRAELEEQVRKQITDIDRILHGICYDCVNDCRFDTDDETRCNSYKSVKESRAENERLRVIEEKARVFTKRIRIYPNGQGASVVLTFEELMDLHELLKLGTKLGTELEQKGGADGER